MKSIRNKLVVYFLLISIIPIMVLGTSIYYFTSREAKGRIQNEMFNTVQQIGKNVESGLLNIQKYMYLIFTDETIQELFAQYDFSKDHAELFSKKGTLGKIFSYYFEGERHLAAAAIFDIDGGEYIYRNNIARDLSELRETQWFSRTLDSDGQIYWMGPEKLIDRYNKEHNVFSVSQLLKDIKNIQPLHSIAVIYLSFSESMFGNIYSGIQMGQEDRVMIIDDSGRIVSHSNKELISMDASGDEYYTRVKEQPAIQGIFHHAYNDRNMVVSYYKIPSFNWTIIKMVPYEYVARQIRPISWMTLISCLISFVGTLLLSIFISRGIAKPLLELNAAMGKVEKGNFTARLIPGSQDEIGIIQSRFNKMTQRIDELFHKTIQAEYQKNQEQLKALQYQVNPHFLYNSLNTIRLMAILSNCNNIRLMVEALTRLLKNAVGKMGEMVPVSVEINNIKDFIYIQQIKNDGKLQVDYHIEQQLVSCLIPNFILQPLVENAIFHGLEPRKNITGSLKIQGLLKEDCVVFLIEDDGIGMTEEQIQRIFIEDETDKGFVKIGIRNVDQRIKLNFGEIYGVSISSVVGQGTLIKVELPIIYGKERVINVEDDGGR